MTSGSFRIRILMHHCEYEYLRGRQISLPMVFDERHKTECVSQPMHQIVNRFAAAEVAIQLLLLTGTPTMAGMRSDLDLRCGL